MTNGSFFGVQLKERDEVVLSNAAIELYAEIPEKPTPSVLDAEETSSDSTEPTSADVFAGITAYVSEHPELVDKVGKSFLFSLTDPASTWLIDLSRGDGSVRSGSGQADYPNPERC